MYKRLLLILAALCALALGGCKKRETIDLSSLHTTEAVEKETLAETEESTAPAESESGSETGTSVKAAIEKETSGSAMIEYPVVSNMTDQEKQSQVNALLKANAMAAASVYSGDVEIKATVESVNLKRITVTYRGTQKESGKTKRIFFANTVDLENAANVGLSDLTDAYTLAGYIASGDYKLTDISGDEAAIRSELNGSGRTTDYYYKLLQKADFTGSYSDASAETSSEWPEVFSYEKAGVVYASLPVSSGSGDYVLIHYSPDNK